MAIKDVTEMWSRQTGGTESADGKTFSAKFASAYQVVHDAGEARRSILNHSSIPREGDVFREGGVSIGGVFCVSRSVERVGPVLSVVSCNYAGEFANGDLDDDPLNAPPVIVRSNRLVNVEVDTDFDGVPITNSVGDPVTGITTDISDFTIQITRNFASVNQYAIRQYLRSHNSDTFDGWPPGTARFRTYAAEEIIGSSRSYFVVNATIEFREPYNTIPERAWYARYRNEGMRERVGVKVEFTGGGGYGATGYAITRGGAITAIVITNTGRQYTSAPTVTITAAAGTGATATATLTKDRVTSVNVSSGGSGYRSKLVRIVDDNKEEITSPALLAADGSRLLNTTEAVWIERPMSGALPYSALGLL